jgi:hypothetical protein
MQTTVVSEQWWVVEQQRTRGTGKRRRVLPCAASKLGVI